MHRYQIIARNWSQLLRIRTSHQRKCQHCFTGQCPINGGRGRGLADAPLHGVNRHFEAQTITGHDGFAKTGVFNAGKQGDFALIFG